MNQVPSRAVRDGLNYIDTTYGFLLERGYTIISAEDADVGWQILLGKPGLMVKILRTRGDDYVSFRAGTQPADEFTDIESVIYAATGEKIPPFESTNPKVLAQYLDRIEAYFAGEYVNNKDGLRAAQDEYYAAFSQGGVVVPPEPESIPSSPSPKIIPILHYPLMAIILLLLFGALLTLYMVLLDRLLAAFSLETDSIGLFMGVIPVLLAIGTMLLFRRQRKKG